MCFNIFRDIKMPSLNLINDSNAEYSLDSQFNSLDIFMKNVLYVKDIFRSAFFMLAIFLFPANLWAISGSGSSFLGLIDESGSDDSFLNKSRVGSSYFLADMDSNQDPSSILGGDDGFLGSELEPQWKKVEHGVTLTKSQQKFNGLDVFGGEIVSRSAKNEVNQAGYLFKGINVDKKPRLSKKMAIAKVNKKFGTESKVEGKLGILPTKSGAKLSYRFTVAKSISEFYVVYMDANNGKILMMFNTVDSLGASSVKEIRKGIKHAFNGNKGVDANKQAGIKMVTGKGKDLNGKQFKIPVAEFDSQVYSLMDLDKKIVTLDANRQNRTDPLGKFTRSKADDADPIISEKKNVWNNKAGVSAHYHAGLISDFMKNKLKRNGLDDDGGPILSIVNVAHEDRSMNDNAFYNSGWKVMFYLVGSWDGKSGRFKNLAGALDVSGHEISHAITAHTSKLVYRNESGAMNESLSDMMGTAIEYYYDRKNFDWAIGEDIIAPSNQHDNGALRFMDQPNKGGQPDTYKGKLWYSGKGDAGGVHTNSGVGNKAFYMMAAGGEHNGVIVPSIGMDKAVQVIYRANSVYLTSRSQYFDFAKGCILAAKDLYGEEVAKKVFLAWKSVNLEVEGLVKDTFESKPTPRTSEPSPHKSEPAPRKSEPEPRKKDREPAPQERKKEIPREPNPPREENDSVISDDGFLGDL
jgi:bacillolysin